MDGRQLAQSGVPWRDILLIHASREEVRPFINRLNRAFGAEVAIDRTQAAPQNQMGVCSLNVATGLESPIVFLMGAHDLYEQEESVRLFDDNQVVIVYGMDLQTSSSDFISY